VGRRQRCPETRAQIKARAVDEQEAAVEIGGDLAKQLAGQTFNTWRQEFTFQLSVSF